MMHPRIMILMLGMSFTGFFGIAVADKPHRLAYSQKQGIEVLAKTDRGGWCHDNLQLQVIAKDGGLFQGDGIQTLMRKLGVAIKGECAKARQADVKGYTEGSTTRLYQASTTKESNWTLTPTAEITPLAENSRQLQTDTVATEPRMLEVTAVAGVPGKLLPFAVGDWIPPSPDAPPETFVIFNETFDFQVTTPDGECNILFPSRVKTELQKELQKFSITTSKGMGCVKGYIHGKGQVKSRIETTPSKEVSEGYFDGKIWGNAHRPIEEGKQIPLAAFSHGYFTGERVIEDIKNVQEYDVKTTDDKCALHYSDYNDSKKPTLHIKVTGVGCRNGYLHGQGQVAVLETNGNSVIDYVGAFSHGYFTKDRVLDMPFTHRFTRYGDEFDTLEKDYIVYTIASDANRQIHYFGILSKQNSVDVNHPAWWDGCESASIIAITERRDLFFDQSNSASLRSLLHDMVNYATSMCPDVQARGSINIYVTEPFNWYQIPAPEQGTIGYINSMTQFNGSSQDVLNVYYAADFVHRSACQSVPFLLCDGENYQFYPQKPEDWHFSEGNFVIKHYQQQQQKENEQNAQLEKAWLNAFGDYQSLQNANRLQRLGYLLTKTYSPDTESFTLGDAPYLAAISLSTQKEIKTTLLLHVSEVDGGNAQSDWPSPVFLKLDERNQASINQEGWYIVDGNITGSLEEGDDPNLLAGVMNVWNAVRCEQDYCNEVNEVLSLVQKVNGLPDWNPNRFDDYDACSGESCRTTGVFTAKINTTARQDRNDTAPIAFDIKKGEKMLWLTSVVATEPIPIEVLAPSKIGDTTAQPGDIFHKVINEGEGFCKVIYKGKLVEGVTAYDEKSFKPLKDINQDTSTEWGKVINSKGQQGWVKNESNIFWGLSSYENSNERAAFDKALEEENHE